MTDETILHSHLEYIDYIFLMVNKQPNKVDGKIGPDLFTVTGSNIVEVIRDIDLSNIREVSFDNPVEHTIEKMFYGINFSYDDEPSLDECINKENSMWSGKSSWIGISHGIVCGYYPDWKKIYYPDDEGFKRFIKHLEIIQL